MFKRMLLLLSPYWDRVVLAAVLSLMISGINGALAWLVKPALDGIFLEKNRMLLSLLPLAILILYLSRGGLSFLQSYLMRSVGVKIVREMRNRLYNHLVFLPIDDFKKDSTGAILSRTINDAAQLQGLLAFNIKDIFVEGATVIALIFVAIYRRWDLALLSITVLPAAFYGAQRLGKRLKKTSKESQKKISALTEFLAETFSGIKMIKVFNRQDALTEKFRERNQGFYREQMRSVRIIELTSLMMEIVGGIGIAFVLWFGGRLVVNNVMTPGDFFSFLAAIFMVFTPAKRLVSANNGIQQSKASLERLDEIFSKEKEREGTGELKSLQDRIRFEDVSFKYTTSRYYILENINLDIKKGEIIAIVGKSGGGKTTLVDLIPRFYDPSAGGIYFDNTNIANVSLNSLRRHIGLVSQDVILFNDTVRANITFGSEGAPDEKVIMAAKAAHAHDFILELPSGYDTIIGEKGVMISGGQRQRLSIARAVLKDPSILLLDEATSSLDTESEMIVQTALDELMKNRTTIVIAHRLSTIMKADRIVVIDKGRILEIGSHDNLLKNEGIYKKLYDLQLSSQHAQ
ncbi:MAG: ABC transporter ATP-binding protein/permease [Nitrospirae bacterium]|nr:ABC transporter ATP-binding protein/permease [Nitrospirota bacterium]